MEPHGLSNTSVTEVSYLFLIPLFVLCGAFLNGALGLRLQRRFGERAITAVGMGLPVASALVAWVAFIQLLGLPTEARTLYDYLWTVVSVGHLQVDLAFALDPLGMTMVLVVTNVGALIHLYSVGYMHGEKGYWRFFSFMNLFLFAMLLLVVGDNLILMFVGWEGVGLCSYLLISFYYWDTSTAKGLPPAPSGMKAFIVNRVGDVCFTIGMLLLFWALGGYFGGPGQPQDMTVTFRELAQRVNLIAGHEVGFGIGAATLIGLLFFGGATGKSAQIPLHVWLPDAMAGPTPVSALIHAATMVTAGVYVVARLSFLFVASPVAMTVVATVGCGTAFFAATVALVQTDIKKVLAYSTVSQLGFMFLAVGSGAYWVGIFHLVTHAFFKAALFLGSGSVIHACRGEQDMRRMGGLGKVMKTTAWTYGAASLALAGFPLTAGFFSKDEILYKVFASGNLLIDGRILWVVAAASAFMTAFYVARTFYMTFSGEFRGGHEAEHHLHESPKTMTFVLQVLGVLALGAGLLGLPHLWHLPNLFEQWLEPSFALAEPHVAEAAFAGPGWGWGLMALSVCIALGGLWLSRRFYKDAQSEVPAGLAARFPRLHRTLAAKYYVDEAYQATLVRGTLGLSRALGWFDATIVDGAVNLVGALGRFFGRLDGAFDKFVVDGLVNLVAHVAIGLGRDLRRLQTGRLDTYLYGILGGSLVVILVAYLVR